MTIIICKLQRKGGSKVEIFGKTYHFKPASGDGSERDIAHTCDIPDSDARALYRLLSIKEAYELADPEAVLPAHPKAEIGQTIGNQKIDPNKPAPVIIKNGDGEEIDLTELGPEPLRLLARDTFGIAVHNKWKDQTVIQKIVEATRNEN